MSIVCEIQLNISPSRSECSPFEKKILLPHLLLGSGRSKVLLCECLGQHPTGTGINRRRPSSWLYGYRFPSSSSSINSGPGSSFTMGLLYRFCTIPALLLRSSSRSGQHDLCSGWPSVEEFFPLPGPLNSLLHRHLKRNNF